MVMSNEDIKQKKKTHVTTVPCAAFSFKSVDVFPLLRFDHPSALRLAAEPTWGRTFGAKPNAFSCFGSTFIFSLEKGFFMPSDGNDGLMEML